MRFIVTMDCNKEDAARAKEIAEEKMKAGDFVEARKFVIKAQRLFPNLEHIPQMIAICDVHSSAIKKIKGLDNWYSVLQVQPSADADTIRKQYRKLAGLLHPDKNKFAGAEDAFNLVGKANRLFSDQIKRSQYDVRYRSHSMFANKHVNANSSRHCAAANNATENIASVYTFWTRCRHCGHWYKYLREYMNTVMHCSSCRKSYFAMEIPKADVLKPQHEVKEPDTSAAKSIPDLSAPKKNEAAKKRRKAVEESSKIFEVDSSDVAGAKTDTNEFNMRKSSGKKPQVSYTEGRRDGDFVSPPNKKTKSESDFVKKQTAEANKSPELANSGVSSHDYKENTKKNANSGNGDILSAKNKESEGCDGNGEDAALSTKIDRVKNGYKANGNPNTLDTPDPEFNVFEVERKIENFAVNQVWSTIDSRDSMPRKYARVKKVLNPEFKLRITHLVPVRDNKDESIPVACGKFKNGKTEEVEDRSIFSAQMHHSSCNRIVSIYPRKGEIWAIFRDWNEERNTSLKKYKYNFVEILTDFHDVDGLAVAYLGKLKGSVRLFHWEAQNGVCQIQFTPKEMLRFSHKIPAVKMTGKEKECVPANSYVLDSAALPKDIFQVDAVDMEMNSEIRTGKTEDPYPEAPKVGAKTKPVRETAPSPKKHRKSEDDNGLCSNLGEVKGGTNRSHDFSSCKVDEKNPPNKSSKTIDLKSKELGEIQKLIERQTSELGVMHNQRDSIRMLIQEQSEELVAKVKRHEEILETICRNSSGMEERTTRKTKDLALILDKIEKSDKQLATVNEQLESRRRLLEIQSVELVSKENELGCVRDSIKLSNSDLKLKEKMVQSLNNRITVCGKMIDSKSKDLGEIQKLIEQQNNELGVMHNQCDSIRLFIEGLSEELVAKEMELECVVESSKHFKFDIEVKEKRVQELNNLIKFSAEQLDMKSKELGEIERELELKKRLRQMSTDLVKHEKQPAAAPINDSSQQNAAETEPVNEEALTHNRFAASLTRHEVATVLRALPNPAEFVLEEVQELISEELDLQDSLLEILVLFFEELTEIQRSDDPQLQDKATQVATLWKGKITIIAPKSSLEALAFLLFIVAYGLKELINEEEIALLASSIAHYEQAPNLFNSLCLNREIRKFVNELIKKSQYIPAVRLICLFNLNDEFSPSHFLEKEIINLRQSALEKRPTESSQAKDKDAGRLRAILELVADYKLKINLPGDLIAKLMIQRENSAPLVRCSLKHQTSSSNPQANSPNPASVQSSSVDLRVPKPEFNPT